MGNFKTQPGVDQWLHLVPGSYHCLEQWQRPGIGCNRRSTSSCVLMSSLTMFLDFCPPIQPIVEAGGVELLCKLTSSPSSALRLNGIWGLMSMAFQAEQKIKSSILGTLGTDQLFRLLTDTNVDILMKTLGLLRNLLCSKPVGINFEKHQG